MGLSEKLWEKFRYMHTQIKNLFVLIGDNYATFPIQQVNNQNQKRVICLLARTNFVYSKIIFFGLFFISKYLFMKFCIFFRCIRIEYNLILEYLVFQIKICFQYHKRRQRWTISLLCDYYAVWYKWSKFDIIVFFCDVNIYKNFNVKRKVVFYNNWTGKSSVSTLIYSVLIRSICC